MTQNAHHSPFFLRFTASFDNFLSAVIQMFLYCQLFYAGIYTQFLYNIFENESNALHISAMFHLNGKLRSNKLCIFSLWLVRVLNLPRGFILTKKEYIDPQKNSGTEGHWGALF